MSSFNVDLTTEDRKIAYFSMEIGLESGVPTYSGGLGVLAGDTIRSAADLKVPMVAVSLVHRRGHFYQRLDHAGQQSEEPVVWALDDYLEELPSRASTTIEGRTVRIRTWKYTVTGLGGYTVPVYLLDTDLPENSAWDRTLTNELYGGDARYRLCQEIVLGIGGVRALRALGFKQLQRYHMNEGHSGLLTLELLDEQARRAGREQITRDDLDPVRRQCVFTTHTPVPSGHDKFPMDLVLQVLGRREVYDMKDVFCCDGLLNMTYLALNLSHYINGVAERHGLVSQKMFSKYSIDSITNGVHASSWTSPAFAKLYDRYIPTWKTDNFDLRYALEIPGEEIWRSHQQQKRALLDYVNRETNAGMDIDALTLGYARRMTAYKRPDLLFRDIGELERISEKAGPVQVVYAGKAHPQDQPGKQIIRQIFEAASNLKKTRFAYLENYDMQMARMLTSGVDVWLNTPEPPLEASGTSGMKAALNGVPSLSILDGWWLEGCIEGITGWSIGDDRREPGASDGEKDARSLYDKLERMLIPAYYVRRPQFIDIMRHAIALNGSFFNTQRMLQQYVLRAYFL
jgi:starch phosphorylase